MRYYAWLLLMGSAGLVRADPRVQHMMERISEEASVFAQQAPNVIGQETLQQRALKPSRRFHPRIGEAALEQPKPEWQTREIISEYGFSAFSSKPGVLHEFRRVTAVDGRKVEQKDKALDALAKSITSNSDNQKRRALKDFEKYGLLGAASDFGQLILMFSRSNLDKYEFNVEGPRLLGAERALVFSYKQMDGAQGLTIFADGKALHERLEGEIWVRASDYLPLRITIVSVRGEGQKGVREQAQVDYVMTQYGFELPISVVHSEYRARGPVAENRFQYSNFKRFGADAQIDFTAVPEPPAK
ncbi:MAG TPA: hypothetical protein VKV15_27360 [Bryobacteraceae bacterium]|nr:hypothetical protein [Bryobacteraceae bacterium]